MHVFVQSPACMCLHNFHSLRDKLNEKKGKQLIHSSTMIVWLRLPFCARSASYFLQDALIDVSENMQKIQ